MQRNESYHYKIILNIHIEPSVTYYIYRPVWFSLNATNMGMFFFFSFCFLLMNGERYLNLHSSFHEETPPL